MQVTEQLLQKVFPNPPVREVAFEIRFNPLLKVQRDVADFQERIVRGYPSYSRERLLIDADEVDAWRFTSEDGAHTIRLSERSFGFITNRYSSFENYKSELLARLAVFTDVFAVKIVKRVGLRYINNIPVEIDSGQRLLSEYVNPLIDLQRFRVEELTRFACEVRLRKDKGNLTIRTGLINIPPGVTGTVQRGSVYILDLDFYDERELAIPTSELLDEFHREIQDEFLAHLKEEYLRIMEKVPSQRS